LKDRFLPYGTKFPGLGGILKSKPEDFVVEEIPAYLPCGEGEHRFLWIEKQNLDSRSMLRHISKRLSLKPSEIGLAGMKDRKAVTRQWISIPASSDRLLDSVKFEGFRILKSKRHRNKLRTGHLKGNRFTIAIRQYRQSVFDKYFHELFETIRKQGFPNYYGEQRFGVENRNIVLGLELLRGEKKPSHLPRRDRKFLLKIAISAVQSWLFNLVLARRIDEGTTSRVQRGDVMQKTETEGCFVVEDVAKEQYRLEAGEIVVTGPMFGCSNLSAKNRAGEIEEEVLASVNLSCEDFVRFPKIARGTRRPLKAYAQDLQFEVEAEVLRMRFSLKPGVYATSILRETMKPESLGDDVEEEGSA